MSRAGDQGDTEPAVEPLADPPVFDEIGERYGEDVAAELSEVWTTICRGWASDFFSIAPDEPEAMLAVYISKPEYLSGHEVQDLERFASDLGKLRPSSRSFASLTAIEHSILRILRRGARRKLAAEQDDGGDR